MQVANEMQLVHRKFMPLFKIRYLHFYNTFITLSTCLAKSSNSKSTSQTNYLTSMSLYNIFILYYNKLLFNIMQNPVAGQSDEKERHSKEDEGMY